MGCIHWVRPKAQLGKPPHFPCKGAMKANDDQCKGAMTAKDGRGS